MYKCPVCGGKIGYKRLDDQERRVVFQADGKVKDVEEGSSDGYTRWECTTDESHDLGVELRKQLDDELLDAAEEALC